MQEKKTVAAVMACRSRGGSAGELANTARKIRTCVACSNVLEGLWNTSLGWFLPLTKVSTAERFISFWLFFLVLLDHGLSTP